MPEQSDISKTQIINEQQRLEKAGRLHWIHWLVLIASLVLTIGVWQYSVSQINEKNKNRFEREAQRTIAMVLERMQKYEDALWSGVAAINACQNNIDLDMWKQFSKSLNIETKYPGINGIGVIKYIPPDQYTTFLQGQRLKRPDFNIHPTHDNSSYWPIIYIEPVELNAAAVGLDMAHETNRHQAALKARSTGKAQITGPITLVQDKEKTPGFLFYAPYYKLKPDGKASKREEDFVGMVYAPFIASKLMQGTLEKKSRHVGISITDQQDLLFDEHNENELDYDPDPLFKLTRKVSIYGREWTFDVRSAKSFRTASQNNQPIMILAGGIAIDSLLLYLFLAMTRTNRYALDFAGRMSRGFRNKADELETMVDKLAESNEELEHFAYVSSHDLQEPLRMVTNFTELLAFQYSDKLDEDGKKYIKYAQSSALRMKDLISDLLEFSRVKREIDVHEDVDMNQSLDYALDNLKDNIEQSDATVTYEKLPTIKSQGFRIAQLFQNIIGNAIKYHRSDLKPTIHISTQEQDSDWLISIEDNGIGMKPEYCKQIFIPFKRLHGNDEYQGTGIGLAICKKVVDSLNGEIWAESQPDQGTTIHIQIPKSESVTNAPQTITHESGTT